MARRGRPRLNRPAIDLGTPELIRKRMHISPKDTTLSTSPIDTIMARRLISDEAHSAAVYFAALRKMVFGKAHPGAIDLTAISSGSPDEMDVGSAERRYRAACEAMKRQGRQALDAVENLVVHERWPKWVIDKAISGNDASYRHFCTGISALLGWYKGKDRKAA